MDQTGAGPSGEQQNYEQPDAPQDEGNPEAAIPQDNDEEQLEALLNQHQEIIEAGDRLHDRQDIYNIRTHDFFTVEALIEELRIIYHRQRRLTKSRNTGEPYRDNLCLFRCLALHEGAGESSLERASKACFERYLQETSLAREDFCGVDLTELSVVEELFSVSIYVYSIDESKHAVCIRRSVKDFPSMHVNLHENHFSFIADFQNYSNCFVCSKCDKIFPKPYELCRHEKRCDINVKHKFPGKVYQLPKTVFQELEDMGFQFETTDTFFPYFATWDIESFQYDVRAESNARLQWKAEHVPASISVASNVPGYESAHCFVTDGDSKQLVSDFVEYVFEISDTSYRLLNEKFENVFSELDTMLTNLPSEDEKGKLQLLRLKKKLDQYLREMPVIGFNSGLATTST
ncbi:Zinc finger and SCAN domain-containing 22 [Paramuricea clavata]|uniref:Zinc finger and SCAN domain-containing 22 n=1 Tax=Paramuricea clavata TaxID=317549 RepID=A0A6S7ILS4_PARCT|nr:Zinc finger and SCAN domain-containing 22 [Paramuricea clavata]